MIKIYGMKTCPYCEYVERQVEGDEHFEVIDIASHVHKLAEFLHLRDTSHVFDHSKLIGDVGIPCFVLEDGTITLNPADVGLKEYNPADGPACSIDGSGC